MKQQTITPKIIELAKKIVELWPMPIYEGCWIAKAIYGDLSGNRDYKACQVTWLLHKGFQVIDTTRGLEDMPIKYFPIPDIGDCLEKLKGLDSEWRTHQLVAVFDGLLTYDTMTTQIFHEALLSALLEVLEDNAK